MQNDFLTKHILPKCFKSFISKISMEARTKENFYKKAEIRFRFVYTLSLYLILRKYSTENENFSPSKNKIGRRIVPLPKFISDFYSVTMVTDFIL